MSFIAVYITHASKKEAQKLCKLLLDQKIIACSNIYPVQSEYYWQGTIENEQEWVSIVKTQKKHWKTLRKFVEKNHPYTTPCIMKFRVKANKSYENWIINSTEIKKPSSNK